MSIFSKVKAVRPKRSTFDLTHSNKLTCNMGELVPFMCQPVVPGDTWSNRSKLLIRFAPLIAPVMHKISVYTHFFYVPYRLVWDNWESFWTGNNDNSKQEFNGTFPQLTYCDDMFVQAKGGPMEKLFKPGSLADYLGLPTSEQVTSSSSTAMMNENVSALPFRAYQLIYNEYYRDENLVPEIPIPTDDGLHSIQRPQDGHATEVTAGLMTLRRRAWQKDYFTSALPWPQKGAQQYVPVTTVIEAGTKIEVKPAAASTSSDAGLSVYGTEGQLLGTMILDQSESSGRLVFQKAGGGNFSSQPNAFAANAGYITLKDLQAAGASFDINSLRRSNRIQQWLERNARGGSRYIESLASHFGVVSDDLRLQRPEMIGGGKAPVQISDTLQTSQTTETSPQGQYAGVGFAYGTSNSFRRTFKEAGLIIGIMSVMPKPGYMSGISRHWTKFDKFDYYWPEFAKLGEQPILNKELSVLSSDPNGTFGYAPRYAEYKYIPDTVHGEFKDSLSFWNLARKFDTAPALNEEFITCNPSNRIFAVEDASEHHLFVEILNECKARRPMPYLPDPSL